MRRLAPTQLQVPVNAVYLLNDIRDKGLKAAKAERPKAKFARLLTKLKEALEFWSSV